MHVHTYTHTHTLYHIHTFPRHTHSFWDLGFFLRLKTKQKTSLETRTKGSLLGNGRKSSLLTGKIENIPQELGGLAKVI